MKRLNPGYLLAIALLAGSACTADEAVPTITADMADHRVGQVVWLEADFELALSCNAAACDGRRPCNNCWGRYVVRAADGNPLVELVGTEALGGPVAVGTLPQSCYDAPCDRGLNLGCQGNDLELECAPTLPTSIARAFGRLERSPDSAGPAYGNGRFQLQVEMIEAADDLTVGVFPASAPGNYAGGDLTLRVVE